MKAVAVVNIASFLCQNARESIMAAASRWGADYVEVTTRRLAHGYPSVEKSTVAERLLGYHHICVLDADVVISESAPSIFDAAGIGGFCAVKDMQSQCEPFRKENTERHEKLMVDARTIIAHEPISVDDSFNAGVMVFRFGWPSRQMQCLAEFFPDDCTSLMEQALTNLAFAGRVTYLDPKWNYLWGDNTDPMPCYIQHFHTPHQKNAQTQKWRT